MSEETLIIIFLSILTYFFFKYLFNYISPFFVGWVISIVVEPIVAILHKKMKLSKTISVSITLIIFCIIILLLLNVILTKIIHEGNSFIKNIPIYKEHLILIINNLKNKLSHIYTMFPVDAHNTIDATIITISNTAISTLGKILKNSSLNIVSQIPNFFMFFIVTMISAFFFTKDKEMVNLFISNQLPEHWKKTLSKANTNITKALGGYIKAQLIMAVITSIISIVGLLIIHYPYAFFLGIIISAVDALPILGSGIILWPLSLTNLISGNYKLASGLIIIYLIIMLTRQISEPKIISKQTGLHPLLSLISVFIGIKAFGLSGFIIGPLLVIIITEHCKNNS